MNNMRRTTCALLALAVITGGAGSAATSGALPRPARSTTLLPGVTMTPAQLQQYRQQLGRMESTSPRVRVAGANAASVIQTAPLLPPRRIDAETTGLVALAIGDVTNDSRADMVAFGVRPSPDDGLGRIVVYPLDPGGIPGAPIVSDVNSQLAAPGPLGMALMPVLGTRPDLVVWGSFWIEIYSVAANGRATATPVTITPGLAVRNVVIANLDADGRPDLIVSGEDYDDPALPTVVRRYLQTPGGGFVAAGAESRFSGGYGVLADLDGDGIIDELDGVGGNTSFGFTYRLGLADGTFAAPVSVMESTSAYSSVGRLSVADVDGNGLADVLLTTGEGARVRFQTAPGTFSTTVIPNSGSAGNISQASLGDLDGNGLRDVILWTDGYNVMQIAMQTSARVFTAAGLYDVLSGGYPSFFDTNAAIADANGDGKADVLSLTAGVVAYYNSAGSYPVLDASVTSTAQVEDDSPTAPIKWMHRVSNAGPSALVDGFLLQNLPVLYELTGSNASCTFFVTLVVCPIAALPAGESTTIVIQAKPVAARTADATLPSLVSVFNDGPEIDPLPANDSATVSASVRGHPEELQADGDELFVYENAGESIIPVIGAAGSSPVARCGGWYLEGPNPADGGIVGATNGTACISPGQKGTSRGLVGLRDGTTPNGLLRYNLAVSAGPVTLPGSRTFSIVDDDGSDPRLTSSGAQPFEAWPALFSSAQTLHTPQGLELPKSAAIGDINGDGRKDLAVSFGDSGGTWISVWLQQANGTLSSTPLKWTGTHSIPSLAIADVSGDGVAEIIVPQYTELDVVRLINGQLQTVDAVAMDCWHVAAADLDLDGFNDIVVANGRDQSVDGPSHWLANVTVFRGNAQRTLDANPYRFAMPYNASRSQLVIGKFDDDARLDIAITSSGTTTFPSASIAFQKSDGSFAAPVAVWIAGPGYFDGIAFGDNVTTGDFNGDGRTDLAISSYLGQYLPDIWIFEDLRHDDFARPTQRLYSGYATSLGAIDIDHDGRDDLLADNSVPPGGPRTPVQVFLQDASGKLTGAGSLAKFGSGLADPWIQKLATGDLDGDGLADAVILDSMDGYVQVMHSSATNQAVQITILESGNSVVAGSRTRYRLRVTNAGARRSLEIPLGWALPQGFATTQIVGAKGACHVSASTAECLLPQLDAGGYVDVMLAGSFSSAGSYTMSITAGPGGDYGGGSVSTTVTAPTSSGGSSGGGSSSGGSSGGGGSLEWFSLAWLLACLGRRVVRR
jgi:hypothetical protein